MATVRQHLTKAHEAMAGHHREMSKCHLAAMGKTTNHEQEFHKAAAAAHDAAAESHLAMCEACSKAADADMNKLEPPAMSRVAPTAPGIKLVPRPGSPPLQKEAVDEEFAALVKISDDEE